MQGFSDSQPNRVFESTGTEKSSKSGLMIGLFASLVFILIVISSGLLFLWTKKTKTINEGIFDQQVSSNSTINSLSSKESEIFPSSSVTFLKTVDYKTKIIVVSDEGYSESVYLTDHQLSKEGSKKLFFLPDTMSGGIYYIEKVTYNRDNGNDIFLIGWQGGDGGDYALVKIDGTLISDSVIQSKQMLDSFHGSITVREFSQNEEGEIYALFNSYSVDNRKASFLIHLNTGELEGRITITQLDT